MEWFNSLDVVSKIQLGGILVAGIVTLWGVLLIVKNLGDD